MAEGDSAEPFYMEPGELFKLVHEERAWVMMMLFICSCRNSNNRSTCPPFSTPPPLANSFVLGTAIINTQPAHRYIPIGYSPRGINESTCDDATIMSQSTLAAGVEGRNGGIKEQKFQG